jgi:hypothetical protein
MAYRYAVPIILLPAFVLLLPAVLLSAVALAVERP